MNILPKKRWHVRTRENIARVRRDEAQAAEEEKERERRIKLAEKEARRDLMRAEARSRYGFNGPSKEESDEEKTRKVADTEGHINFFAEEEAGLVSSTAVNKEHEEEQKQEREKYEKQIGYLTYLGQDTNEATGKVSWYNKCPEREEPGLALKEEMGLKHKVMSDPLNAFKKLCGGSSKVVHAVTSVSKLSSPQLSADNSVKRKSKRSKTPDKFSNSTKHKSRKKHKKKHKKEKKHKAISNDRVASDRDSDHSTSSDDSHSIGSEDENEKRQKLEKLRAERLHRERDEKKKAAKLMAKINGVTYTDDDEKPQPQPVMKQRYNSQFNPDIAKQNFEDQRYRF